MNVSNQTLLYYIHHLLKSTDRNQRIFVNVKKKYYSEIIFCPRLLIGFNNFQLLTPQNIVQANYEEPIAIQNRLGWTFFGKYDISLEADQYVNRYEITNTELDEIIKDFFNLSWV